jgi:hypothetical protein
MSPETCRRHLGAAPMLASGETSSNAEIIAHDAVTPQGAAQTGTVAYNTKSDGRKKKEVQNDHAIQGTAATRTEAPQTHIATDGALVALDQAELAIIELSKIEDINPALDQLEALRLLVSRGEKARETANRCTVLRLRTQRRGGEILLETERATGGGDHRLPAVTTAPTLAQLGVSKRQSAQWQRLAAIGRGHFDQVIDDALESGEELSISTLLKALGVSRSQRGVSGATEVITVAPACTATSGIKSQPERSRSNAPQDEAPAASSPSRAVAAPETAVAGDAEEDDRGESSDRAVDELRHNDIDEDADLGHDMSAAGGCDAGQLEPKQCRPRVNAVHAARETLRDLRARTERMDLDSIMAVLREVEALAAALSERIQAERDVEPEPEVEPSNCADIGSGVPIFNDGERWEDVE